MADREPVHCAGWGGPCRDGALATARGAMTPRSVAKRNGELWRCPACSARRTGALLSKLTPAAARTVNRLLGQGVAVLMAATAADIDAATLWGWIRRGESEVAFAAITRAYARGCARNRREEQAIARRAAKLLMGGATVLEAAEALGVSFSRLRGLIIRARGSDGRAPDPGLAALARRFPTQTRRGRMAKPRCRHCGAVLPGTSGRRAAA